MSLTKNAHIRVQYVNVSKFTMPKFVRTMYECSTLTYVFRSTLSDLVRCILTPATSSNRTMAVDKWKKGGPFLRKQIYHVRLRERERGGGQIPEAKRGEKEREALGSGPAKKDKSWAL